MDKTQSSSLHSSTTSNIRYDHRHVAGGGDWWVSTMDTTKSSSLHSNTTSNSRYGLGRAARGGDCGGCLL